jgi:hypothetical protein
MLSLAIVLTMLGILVNAITLAKVNRETPRFTEGCTTCGYRLPVMQQPLAAFDCPNCQRLLGLGFNLSDPLPR